MRWLVGNVGIAVARAMIRLPPIIALPLLRESIENVKRFAIVSSIKFTISRKKINGKAMELEEFGNGISGWTDRRRFLR